MAGYVRQSAADIVTGAIVLAAPINAEYNALQSAFNGTTGHTHDGTTGNGAKINLTASVSGILPVASGGTNASTTAAARTSLFGVSTTVDNTVPRFNGITGEIQTSGVVISDTNAISGVAGLTSTTGTFSGAVSTGALTVTGTATATTFSGSGSLLTSLPAGQLTGTVVSARITGSYTGITGVGALAAGSITSAFGSIDVGGDPISGGAISGTTGTFTGDIITTNVIRSINTSSIAISGGDTINTGANLQLFGGAHATLPDRSFLDATIHSIRSQDGSSTFLTIQSSGISTTLATTLGETTVSGNVKLSGSVFSTVNTGVTVISGGNATNAGAHIELYGGAHATVANDAFYDAAVHTFRTQAGTTRFTIDTGANTVTSTGALTATGTVTSSQTFTSSTTTVILSTASAGTLYLRPNGAGSTTGQAFLTSAGALDLTAGLTATTGAFSGAVSGTTGTFTSNVTSSQNFISSSTTVVLATTGAGNVLLRPNGAASGTGQFIVNSAGDVTVNGALSVTGGIDGDSATIVGNIRSGGDAAASINTAGVVLQSTGRLIATRSADYSLQLNRTTSDGAVANFHRQGTGVGNISVNGIATAYNTSSDANLKTNLRTFDSGSLIDAIETWKFDWKSGGLGYGVIAQDCYTVFPDAITPPDNKDEYWTADYSKFVPLLLAEVKELRKRIAKLEAK